MAKKTVVSNSTPLINFSTIGQLEILRALFEEIIIPEAVWEELVIKGAHYPQSQLIKNTEWIKRKAITSKNFQELLVHEIDKGEAEAIILAIELNADLVLLDETEAREYAKRQKISFLGSIGVLTLAKQTGVIKQIKPILDDMINKANFWISKELYNAVLIDNHEL